MRQSTFQTRSTAGRWAGACMILGTLFAPLGQAEVLGITPAQYLPTQGAMGVESFSIDGTPFLAIANHNGGGAQYVIDSPIYRWENGAFSQIQAIQTSGAIGWESFTIGGVAYLAVANSSDGVTYDVPSHIYRWNPVTEQFELDRTVNVPHAREWNHFSIDGVDYLALASGAGGASKIYRWEAASLVEIQSIAPGGSTDTHLFSIAGEHYLAAANGGVVADTPIYHWNGSSFDIDPGMTLTDLPSNEVETFTIDGELFMGVTAYGDGVEIYRWSGTGFEWESELPSQQYVYNLTPFEYGGSHYLFAPNFFSSDGTSHPAESTIYRWDGNGFVADRTIATQGGYDGAYFEIGGVSYLGVTNLRDDTTFAVDSVLYALDLSQLPVAEVTATPAEGVAPLTVTVDGSASSDPDGGAIVSYQWSTSDAQSATGPTAEFTFTTAASYSITLTVTDDEGETAEQTVTVPVGSLASSNCEGRASFNAADGRLQLPLMEVATVPLLGGTGRVSGETTVPTSATLRLIPGTTLFEIESVLTAEPDPAATTTCHAVYSIDGVLTVPVVDVPVVTAIGGLTVTTGVESFGGTLELLPMSDLFTITELREIP